MYDVDEPSDVYDLAKRLCHSRHGDNEINKQPENQKGDVLTSLSSGRSAAGSIGIPQHFPNHTWNILVELNLLQEDNGTRALPSFSHRSSPI